MATFKATSKKKDSGVGVFKSTKNKSYDATYVNRWEEESKESSKFLDDYITRRKNQEWMSEDDISNYRSALDRYKSSTDSLANLQRSFGNYSEEDDKKWSEYFSNLSTDIDTASEVYGRYKSADSFNAYLQAVKEDEELGKLDLDAFKKDVDYFKTQSDNVSNLRDQIYAMDTEIGVLEYAANFSAERRAELEEKKKQRAIWEQMLKDAEAEGYDTKWSEANAKYNRAKDIQDRNKVLGMLEGITDPASVNFDPEYDAYVQKGASIENPSYDDSLPKMNIFGWKPYGDGETVNNPVTFTQENEEEFNNADRPDPNLDLLVTEMTEEQIDHYNYLIAKHGRETADIYLESVRNQVKSKKADEFFKTHLEDKWLSEIMYSTVQGLDQFSTGMSTLAGYEGVDNRLLDPQTVGARAREDLYDDSIPVWYNFKDGEWEDKILGSSVGQVAYDAGTNFANMAPSMGIGALSNLIIPGSGAIVGTGLMGASAGGNAYKEALNRGYDEGQAKTYGVLVGGSEALLQYALGGISKLGGKVSNNVIQKMVSGIDNGFARFALEMGGSMAAEGLEEGLQEILNPFFENIAFNADNDLSDVDWEQVAYSYLLGSLSSLGMEGGSTAVNNIKYNSALKAEGKGIVNRGATDSLVALANEMAGVVGGDVGKTLSKRASNITGKKCVNAKAVGKLSVAVNDARIQQNKADLAKALEKKGVNSSKASKYVDILFEMNEEYFKGEKSTFELGTDAQWKKITGDENAYSVLRNIVTDENSSVNIRNLKHLVARVGTKVAEKKTDYGKTAEAEAVRNVKPTVSEDGKTKVVSSDTEVTLNGIDHVEVKKVDGKTEHIGYVKVVDASGNEDVVPTSDVEYANNNEGLIYESFVAMGIDPVYFDTYAKGFNAEDFKTADGNVADDAVTQYALGFQNAYRYGWTGIESELDASVFASKLNPTARKAAYDAGVSASKYSIETKQSALDTAVEERKASGNGKVRTQGKLHMEGIKTKKRTAIQNAGVGLAKRLTSLGIDVYVYESQQNANGEWVDDRGELADNGFYRASDGSIHIDLNAGANGQGIMVYTLSHELVHFMRDQSPREFKVLADLLIKWYGKKGVSVSELIQQRMAEEDLSWDEAYEEVVARSCESFLTDSNIADRIIELQQTDKKAWKVVRDKVLKFLDWMKSLFKDVDVESAEGRFFREINESIDELYGAFYNTLASASETFQWAGSIAEAKNTAETLATAGITVDTDTGSAVMNSVRYAPKTQAEIDKVAQALSESMGVSIEKAKAWVKSETSLTSIILDPSNAMFLDYEADDRYEAIKKNAEYPQGTVDFSNLCKKRREFTALLDKLQKEHPNRIITAAEMEHIRQILIEEDVEVACGLCYVEERRQLLGEIAQGFIDGYKNGTLKEAIAKELDANDSYVPTIYDLITYDGYRALTTEHPSIAKAFQKFNNARGMQAGRLIEGIAEYKRDILKWSQKKVDFVNSVGGLRVFSFSDFEATHLIDLVQVIQDCAAKGVMIQAYTKVPAFANAVKDTNMKVNRSLIAKGTGIKYENGRMVLDLDPVEGIDINDKDFFDSTDSKNVGNVLVGMSNEQIRLAMKTPFVDYIIPFHTGLKGDILKAKKIDHWDNYKNFQTDKEYHPEKVSYNKDGSIKSDGWVVAEKQINVYVDVIQAAEADGKPIKNKVDFVNKFLAVAKEKGLKPRFWNFLDVDANGEYTYTEGYHKFLVDFKLFDQDGNILPQEPVIPEFDDALNARILNEYVAGKKAPVSRDAVYDRLVNEVINGDVKKSSRKTGNSVEKVYNDKNTTKEGLIRGETRQETREAFLRRAVQDVLQVEKRGETAYGYRRTSPSYITERCRQTEEELEKLGIPSVVYDILEVNRGGISSVVTSEATTIRGDAVYINNALTRNPKEVAGHEAYHFWKSSDERTVYTDVLADNIAYSSNEFDLFLSEIADGYSLVDVEIGSKLWEKLMEEAEAYISGFIHSGNHLDWVMPFISDFSEVEAAWNALVNSRSQDIKKSSRRDYAKVDSKAVMTSDRIDDLIEDSGAGKRVDYANYWITSISPTDFLNMTTTTKIQDRTVFDKFPSEWNDDATMDTYDYLGELKKNGQTPYLAINIDTGEVVGHEGRHRLRALEREGIKSVEIVVEFKDDDYRIVKYSPDGKRLRIKDAVKIINQFGTEQTAFITNVIPLNEDYRETILANYGEATSTSDSDIHYSRRSGTSNRSLLANALESVAMEGEERNILRNYKTNIRLLEGEHKKLAKVRKEIDEIKYKKSLSIGEDKLSIAEFERIAKAKAINLGKSDADVKFKLDRSNKKYIASIEGVGIILEADKTFRSQEEMDKLNDLYRESDEIATRITAYDKELLKIEAMKPIKGVLEREKYKARKEEKQKAAEAVAKQRERDANTLREVMNRNAEYRKRGIENRNRTEMRHKIKRVVSELNQLLLHGTKDKHIKIDLQKATAEALSAINMDTINAEKRLEEIQRKIDATNDPNKIAELQETYDRIEMMGENMMNKLTALKNAYEEIKDSSDPLVANAYHQEIEESIKNLRKEVGDTPLREMSLEQLEKVYDTYTMVLYTIRTANKAFKANKAETIGTLANKTMEEVHTVGGTKAKSLVLAKLFKKFFWNGLKPVYAFKAIGSATLSNLFDNVRAGEDTWAVDVSEAKDYFKDVSKKYNYDSWDFDKQYTFRSKTGREFSLSIEQIMSLYAYSKRKQADEHLEKGGFVFDEAIEVKEKTKLGIPLKYEVNVATSHNLSRDILGEIVSTLSDEQKAFVDEMQAYLSDVMGAKGNEVSLEMFGVKLFKEKFYFPLKSAKQFMYEQNEVAGEVRLKNSGFSKETKKFANNPIILSNFMDVWANHVNDMSMYHAFVLPLEDFNRVFNYKTPSTDNLDTESVKMYIQNAYGSQPNQYIKQLLTDLNGGARTDPSADFITKLTGLFKKSAVFASASVVVQQPSAIARASAMIDSKYFVTKLSVAQHNEEWAEVKKYAPVAIIKEMGYFDTHMGRSTVDFIKAKEYDGVADKMKALFTDSGYRDEMLSKAPAVADELSWCYIWNAVKKEIADTTDLKVGSEEFLKKCGERFTEVVVNTQVYDSVLSRSAMMRSKDTGMKMVTAFMAEPTTSINMIADAIIQGKRGNKKGAAKTVGAVVASLILNSILVSFVYAGRDDDEDKTYAEKYVGTLSRELVESSIPLTMIPFVKDIVSIAQGYDVERSDMAIISDLFTAFKKLSNDNLSAYKKVEDFGGAVAAIFGLPVKNIMRDVRAMYNTASSFINGQETTGEGVKQAVKEAVTGKGDSNTKQLYNAIVSGDEAHLERVKGNYKDESTYESAVKKALRENDTRIREALKIRVNEGVTNKYHSIRQEIIDEGKFEQSIVNEALKAEYNYFMGKIEEAADLLKEGDKEASDDIIKDLKKKYKGTFTQDDILKAVKKRAGMLK